MKKLLIILFCLISVQLLSTTYYVSPYTGNDTHSGTDTTNAWATWQKGFATAIAGDTVYYLDGIWMPSTAWAGGNNITRIDPGAGFGHDGTSSDPIVHMAYPGCTPILDGSLFVTDGHYATPVLLTRVEWIKFKGLTIRNFFQRGTSVDYGDTISVVGVNAYECSNLTFENITIHTMGGRGYYFDSRSYYEGYQPDTTRWINCDVYNCIDTLNIDDPPAPGNMSDAWKIVTYSGGVVIIDGCRAWHCSDDGIDLSLKGTGIAYIQNNRLFDLGYLQNGNGNGMKIGADVTSGYFGQTGSDSLAIHAVVRNNLFAWGWEKGTDTGAGIEEIDYEDSPRTNSRIYNNTIYKFMIGIMAGIGDGGHPYRNTVYRNNLVWNSYKPSACEPNEDISIPGYSYPESNNTWDYIARPIPASCPFWWETTDTVTVTEDDFILTSENPTDSLTAYNQLTAARKSDGSLPDITFMKLVSTSDLVDAGTQIPASDSVDLTLSFYGLTPDIGYSEFEPIIADHTVVDRYDDIPEQWIDSVKKMLYIVAGESHSGGVRQSLGLLRDIDPTYMIYSGSYPNSMPIIDTALRITGATWGDLDTYNEWVGSYGEEDWWTTPTAISQTKNGLSYCNTIGYPMDVFGFMWCWDLVGGNSTATVDPVYGVHWFGWARTSGDGPDGPPWGLDAEDTAITGITQCMDTYLAATQGYIDYCADSIPTKIFFSTGPVDDYGSDEAQYQAYIKHEYIRDYVKADPTRILFDYADILCYDDGSSTPNTKTWDGHTFPTATVNNVGDGMYYHIDEVGALRLAKAQWWMLARIAGWDGGLITYTAPAEIDSSATDIITFTLADQTGAATINATNHTVSIEVDYTADITDLTPTITLSYGATVSPLSGVSQDFTSPVTYTVTALDGETEQEWVVTVTQEEEPATPASDSATVKYRGLIIKR